MDESGLKAIREMAKEAGWAEIDHQENISMVSFAKGSSRINLYYSRMTVATIVDHPRYGRNQMFRKRVPMAVLRELFNNPRRHTWHEDRIRGYHMNGKHLASIRSRS